jgi:lysophospholipase L1-like esterase
MTKSALAAYEAQIATAVDEMARQFLADPSLASVIDNWQIPTGGTVMAVGDSITTYRYSYARILAAMVLIRRAGDAFRFVNFGQSGYTSTHGLETTYTQNLAAQPHWVFIMFGVNDCKQFGGSNARTLVSIDEYRANMTEIVNAFLKFNHARPVLLTPTPVVTQITNSNPDFEAMRMTWDNKNLAACSDIIRDLAGQRQLPLIDLFETFGAYPDPAYFLADGLHPNPAGHKIIVQKVLAALA